MLVLRDMGPVALRRELASVGSAGPNAGQGTQGTRAQGSSRYRKYRRYSSQGYKVPVGTVNTVGTSSQE